MDLIHDGQELTGLEWAIRLIVFWLIVGGIPVASVGLVTSALGRSYKYQWQPEWRLVFQAGFVVQICSLALTVPIVLMFLISARWSDGDRWESLAALILFVSVVGGCFALGAWRDLMAAALPEAPPSILG